jgi:hypothetical protein
MIYKLYRKATDDDAGQVLAIVAQEKEIVDIDDIEVFLFKNGTPVEIEIYTGDSMKLNGEGRPLWSVVTWPFNHKWKEITAADDLLEWSKEFKAGDDSTVGNLEKYFE